MYSSGQLEAGLDCPGFTVLLLKPAGLHLAQLCWSMRLPYFQLQHRWTIAAFHEYCDSAMTAIGSDPTQKQLQPGSAGSVEGSRMGLSVVATGTSRMSWCNM